MKTSLLALLAPFLLSPAQAQVGLSIQMGQPGFYGQLNLGDYDPAPELLDPQPSLIDNDGPYAERPVYLRVPPGHAKNWPKHCRRYGACGRRVYFVSDDQDDRWRGYPSKKYKNNKSYKRW